MVFQEAVETKNMSNGAPWYKWFGNKQTKQEKNHFEEKA